MGAIDKMKMAIGRRILNIATVERGRVGGKRVAEIIADCPDEWHFFHWTRSIHALSLGWTMKMISDQRGSCKQLGIETCRNP